jgi:hypothetical protein
VFPARYELNSYIVFRKRLVSKRLIGSFALLLYILGILISGAILLPSKQVQVNLRPTVSRPVCLSAGNPSGTRDQFFLSP